MDAWEDDVPTFPAPMAGRWRASSQVCSREEAPQKSHPMGEEAIGPGRWRDGTFDFVCSTNSRVKRRLCFRPAEAQARKPPTVRPQCGYAGEHTRSSVRFMLAENPLPRRITRCTALPPTLVDMSVFAMPRTSPLRGRHIYPVVETSLGLHFHQHNTPLQHNRAPATTPSASSDTTPSLQR